MTPREVADKAFLALDAIDTHDSEAVACCLESLWESANCPNEDDKLWALMSALAAAHSELDDAAAFHESSQLAAAFVAAYKLGYMHAAEWADEHADDA
jgi:hypothetical protein